MRWRFEGRARFPPHPLPATWAGAKIPAGFKWVQFSVNDQVALGVSAGFKVIHVDPKATAAEANNSSVVLKVTLKKRTLLLMGDAQGGVRSAPETTANSVEKDILSRHAGELDADIFQIGHHGSMTSSRKELIQAVFPQATASASRPRFSLLSAGPTPYVGQVLPDPVIVAEVSNFLPGMNLLSTNTHDRQGGPGNPDNCPAADRVGVEDEAPGGCDNFVLDLK